MAAHRASGSSRRRSASPRTGRVRVRVGPSVRGWPLWGSQGWTEFILCQNLYSRTSRFIASQLGPGRDSAFTLTWCIVIAIIRWGPGTRPPAFCGGDSLSGVAPVPSIVGTAVPRWLAIGLLKN